MNNDKLLSMAGMATRAGKTSAGLFLSELSVKKKHAKLMIISTDAGSATKTKARNMCSYYNVEHIIYGTKAQLGACTGKEDISVLTINDNNFRNAIMKIYLQK